MEPRGIHPQRMLALCRRAMLAGSVPDGYALRWEASGDCDRPIEVCFVSQLSEAIKPVYRDLVIHNDLVGYGYWQSTVDMRFKVPIDRPFFLTMISRCRKCPRCMKKRSDMWAMRAATEISHSTRSWMLTLTLSPDSRFRVALEARRLYGSEDFPAVYRVASRWFTKYLKRVRKKSGARLRFILAAEQHKDGTLHFHALIHESGKEVTKRVLQGEWPYGYSQVKLCDFKAARYVTKYIAKCMLVRVRASLRYGRPYAIVERVVPVTTTERESLTPK